MCQNQVFLVFKNIQNLFFTPRFLLSFFRLLSLVSHHPEFLEKNGLHEELRLFSCFLWWTIPNCVHLDPCTLNFDQIDMTGNHLTMSKNSSTASIEWWLVSNSSYRQDRTKKNKNCTFFKILTGKISKLCAKWKFYWFSKCSQLVFYTKISSLFLQTDVFRFTSSRTSRKNALQKEFCPFSSLLWVNYSRLCSFRPMHTQFSINSTWLEIIWLCQKTVLLPSSNCGWSQIQATNKTE